MASVWLGSTVRSGARTNGTTGSTGRGALGVDALDVDALDVDALDMDALWHCMVFLVGDKSRSRSLALRGCLTPGRLASSN